MEIINYIASNFGAIITIALSVVGTAALIAAVTPTPKDDAAVAQLRKVVDFLAANWGNAKNK